MKTIGLQDIEPDLAEALEKTCAGSILRTGSEP